MDGQYLKMFTVNLIQPFDYLQNDNQAFANRKIGRKEVLPWKNKKCPSCKLGFNTKSSPLKCDGCDSFTHKKQTCLKQVAQNAQFFFVKYAIQPLELNYQP